MPKNSETIEKVPVAWGLFCRHPTSKFEFWFEDEIEFDQNFLERIRWGECYKTEVHYNDGSVEKQKYNCIW
jgi:hypothetical protein